MVAFRAAVRLLDPRIMLLTALPLDKLDWLAAKRKAEEIGAIRSGGAGEPT